MLQQGMWEWTAEQTEGEARNLGADTLGCCKGPKEENHLLCPLGRIALHATRRLVI